MGFESDTNGFNSPINPIARSVQEVHPCPDKTDILRLIKIRRIQFLK